MLDSNSDRFLLEHGWTPYIPTLDLEHLLKIWETESHDLVSQTLKTASTLADTLGRKDFPWWCNLLNLSNGHVRDSIATWWSLLTPNPLRRTRGYPDKITAVRYPRGHYNKEAESDVVNQIALSCIDTIVESLGTPDLILQQTSSEYDTSETWFELPRHRFDKIESLRIERFLLCVWEAENIALIHDIYDRSECKISLKGSNLKSAIEPVLQRIALRSIEKRTISGTLQAPFALKAYTPDVQQFAQEVIAQAKQGHRVSALATGDTGTGKTKCVLAIAKVLQAEGFLVLVVDHETALSFDPPNFIEKVVLIINEVDNWAVDREQDQSGKTERVLGLLDGSTHESILPDSRTSIQKPPCQIVFLMTANTLNRADPAMLRQGRIDVHHHFTHQYVSSVVPTRFTSSSSGKCFPVSGSTLTGSEN